MSLQKRPLILFALAVALTVGSSVSGEAQARRAGGSGGYGGAARPVGPGRSAVVVRGYGGYYAPYYRPYYSYGWYGFGYPFFGVGFGYGYPYPYYGYGYPYGPYPYGYYDPGSSLRIEVKPKEAEVYVDGYYAGVVDDFDGVFQRLHVAPGSHSITLWREGLRTVHQNVYLAPDSTFKLTYNMEPLTAGDVAEPRPTPPPPPPDAQAGPPHGQPGQPGQGPGRSGYGNRGPGPRPLPPPDQPGNAVQATASGTLAVRVQPSNASVLIDGERWEGPEGPGPLVVQVTGGPHHIQIEKQGYESYTADVTVRSGDTTPLNVSLRAR